MSTHYSFEGWLDFKLSTLERSINRTDWYECTDIPKILDKYYYRKKEDCNNDIHINLRRGRRKKHSNS